MSSYVLWNKALWGNRSTFFPEPVIYDFPEEDLTDQKSIPYQANFSKFKIRDVY